MDESPRKPGGRRFLRELLLFGGIPCLILLVVWLRGFLLESGFDRVEKGTARQEVIALIGKPDSVITDHQSIYWCTSWDTNSGSSPAIKEPVEVLVYFPPSICGEAYAMGFDAQGHAVSKSYITSP